MIKVATLMWFFCLASCAPYRVTVDLGSTPEVELWRQQVSDAINEHEARLDALEEDDNGGSNHTPECISQFPGVQHCEW